MWHRVFSFAATTMSCRCFGNSQFRICRARTRTSFFDRLGMTFWGGYCRCPMVSLSNHEGGKSQPSSARLGLNQPVDPVPQILDRIGELHHAVVMADGVGEHV